MSDLERIAAHVRANLLRARAARPDELAHLFRCSRCKAAPGEPCRAGNGAPLFARPRYQGCERAHHALRQLRAEQAQRSPRLRRLLVQLRLQPALGLQRAWSCSLYRAIHAEIWSLPKPRRSGNAARAAARLSHLLRSSREPHHDRRPLRGEALAFVQTIHVRRALGLSDFPEESPC